MVAMRSLKPRSTCMESFIDLLKYLTLPANVNAHSLNIIMDMNIPRSVKNRELTDNRSTNPGPNDNGWKRVLSNGDTKNKLIALFVKILKSPESEEYC